MQKLIDELRKASLRQPINSGLFSAAADEIERLKEFESGAIEIRGMRRKLADELANLKRHENKIKANAIREAAEALYCSDLSCGRQSESEYEVNYLRAYANKLEGQQ